MKSGISLHTKSYLNLLISQIALKGTVHPKMKPFLKPKPISDWVHAKASS